MVGLKLDLEMVSFFLMTSYVVSCVLRSFYSLHLHATLNSLLCIGQRLLNPSLDDISRFRPRLGRFLTHKSLNWMTVDGGLRAYHTTGDALK